MEKVLNKIADIIDDMSIGVLVGMSEHDFLYGYVRALVDTGQLTQEDASMLMKFFDRLIKDKVFLMRIDYE